MKIEAAVKVPWALCMCRTGKEGLLGHLAQVVPGCE